MQSSSQNCSARSWWLSVPDVWPRLMVGSKEVTIAAIVICSSSCRSLPAAILGSLSAAEATACPCNFGGIGCYGSLLDAQWLSMSRLASQQLSRRASMGMQTCCELSSLLSMSMSMQARHKLGSSEGMSAASYVHADLQQDDQG